MAYQAPPDDAVASTIADLPDGALALVLSFLASPGELASAEPTCSSWLRVARESHSWLRLSCRRLGLSENTQCDASHVRQLARSAWASSSSLVSEALAASSTDNPPESVANTLSESTHMTHWSRPCYWSSAGTATERGCDWLLYRLTEPLCLVSSVSLRPYEANFQRGDPLYAPQRARFLLGDAAGEPGASRVSPAAAEEGGESRRGEVGEARRGEVGEEWSSAPGAALPPGSWSYASPVFPVRKANELQMFTLPQPVLVSGGSLLVELYGRTQQQEGDARWYACIAHVRCEGVPLPGWTSREVPRPKGTASVIELIYTPLAQTPFEEHSAASSEEETGV